MLATGPRERLIFSRPKEIVSFAARNQHVWFKERGNAFYHMNLDCFPLPDPDELGTSTREFVSDDGKYCFYCCDNRFRLVDARATPIKNHILRFFKGNSNCTGVWVTSEKARIACFFVVSQEKNGRNVMSYYDMNQANLAQCEFRNFKVQGSIQMMHCMVGEGGSFVFHFLIQNGEDWQLETWTLAQLSENGQWARNVETPLGMILIFSQTSQYMSFVSSDMIAFRVPKAGEGRSTQMVIKYDMRTSPVYSACLVDDVAFLCGLRDLRFYGRFVARGQRTRLASFEYIAELDCKGEIRLDVDPVKRGVYISRGGHFFSLHFTPPEGRPDFQLTGVHSIKYWLFWRLAEAQDVRAAQILSQIPLSLTDQLLILRTQSPGIRFAFLEDVAPSYKSNPRIFKALMLMQLDAWARLEHPETEQQWITQAVDEGVLSVENVKQTTEVYGIEFNSIDTFYEDKCISLIQRRAKNRFAAVQNINTAIEYLPKMTHFEQFIKCALTAHATNPQRVSQIVTDRCNWVCHHLTRYFQDSATPYISDARKTFPDIRAWVQDLFTLWLAQHPNRTTPTLRDLVETAPTKSAEQFAIRAFLSNRRYHDVVPALQFLGYEYQAIRIAKLQSSLYAASLITPETNKKTMLNCTSSILLSVKPEEADLVLKQLITGVDMSTAVTLLSPESTVEDMYKVCRSYISALGNSLQALPAQMKEATDAYEYYVDFLATHPKSPITTNSLKHCDYCHGQLLTDPCVLYPCGHAIHLSCVPRISFVQDPKDHDCPFCGFLAVDLVDYPFTAADDWSVDSPTAVPVGRHSSLPKFNLKKH